MAGPLGKQEDQKEEEISCEWMSFCLKCVELKVPGECLGREVQSDTTNVGQTFGKGIWIKDVDISTICLEVTVETIRGDETPEGSRLIRKFRSLKSIMTFLFVEYTYIAMYVRG